jgi:hypothetical protein
MTRCDRGNRVKQGWAAHPSHPHLMLHQTRWPPTSEADWSAGPAARLGGWLDAGMHGLVISIHYLPWKQVDCCYRLQATIGHHAATAVHRIRYLACSPLSLITHPHPHSHLFYIDSYHHIHTWNSFTSCQSSFKHLSTSHPVPLAANRQSDYIGYLCNPLNASFSFHLST